MCWKLHCQKHTFLFFQDEPLIPLLPLPLPRPLFHPLPLPLALALIIVPVPIPVPVAYHSFGGWKRSAFGGHGVYGMEAVRFYTRLKTVTGRWPSGHHSGAQYTFPSNS